MFEEWEEIVGNISEFESQEFKAAPDGIYQVEISDMQLAKSKNGDPMLKIRFKTVHGDPYTLFYNGVLAQKWQIGQVIELLKSLQIDTTSFVTIDEEHRQMAVNLDKMSKTLSVDLVEGFVYEIQQITKNNFPNYTVLQVADKSNPFT